MTSPRGIITVYSKVIFEMLKEGITEEEIAQEFKVTKAAISRLRRKNWPEDVFPEGLFFTKGAAAMVRVSPGQFKKIAEILGIQPVRSSRRRILWNLDSVNKVAAARICRICQEPLPKGHWKLCEKCQNKRGLPEYRKGK